MAAWVQAIVSSLAIVVGAGVVIWQTRRLRLEQSQREARTIDGLARLLVHLKDHAVEARAEKLKLERWPVGHPAEPHARFLELASALRHLPLESLNGEVPMEALLNARRAARELELLVSPEPELEVNPNFERVFQEYKGILEQQIMLLRIEAKRLMSGGSARPSAAAPS